MSKTMIRMMVLVVVLVFGWGAILIPPASAEMKQKAFGSLPEGAQKVINQIKKGDDKWPFDKDGSTFQNKEKLLPADGKYKEYTVVSADMQKELDAGKKPNRGKLRIIYDTKDKKYYYTADHYKSFFEVTF